MIGECNCASSGLNHRLLGRDPSTGSRDTGEGVVSSLVSEPRVDLAGG